ncbi:primosomal protein N' [Treponema ruminis]|uniref:Replication restart protein PriA n=1 Tax=Treponema ruminis TaxID=744515 RepID=A0A7W8G8H1_9SPIR|nr:primosomal protein N' [Treponema ruminis]MBB5225823.1 primosomal protein N' (replication factor Y) [Treponema ruminis]QSI02512.1 primosomal protein N' [Treponema ruminis]
MKRFLQVVLNIPLNQSFTYLDLENPDGKSRVGFRADLKFGNRRMTGFIVGESESLPADCPVEEAKIRPILRLLDEEPLFDSEIIELAKWISHYYLCSVGEAISSMLPGGRRESDAGGFSFLEETPDTKARTLSDEQQKAVEEILGISNAKGEVSPSAAMASPFPPTPSAGVTSNAPNLHYLYGATGTGKTEVFMQVCERLLAQGKGVIYLVPEIGLTPQVTQAVASRFGNTVAVLHSGLTPSQKLSEWRRILNREARIVIGARSAVFAPLPDLGMIIIDEEHDGSYKSGNTPRYHARQVAMYRCARKQIPLLMGSATPSVEAWNMMKSGGIQRHVLTRRLAGGAMPQVKCVNLTGLSIDGAISPVLQKEIEATLAEKRQTILFLNRRGFTHFFRCNSCGFELKCKNCSVSLTFHKAEKRLRCHYCGYSVSPPQSCPECGSLDVGYSGFGTEFIENEVKAKFPNARIVRVDTDSVSHKGELTEKIDAFKKGEYDIMLGTQMVAKGLNFPNLKLVGVILADTGLHMPDFRAAEKTFALITQVSGRAGRFFPDGKVLVQTYCPDSAPIAYAVAGKTEEFYESEIQTRQMLSFPPFARILRMVFRAPSEAQALSGANGAASILHQILRSLLARPSKFQESAKFTEILGPAECPLSKIAANYRQQIILRGPSVSLLQYMAHTFAENYKAPGEVYIEYDVDPVSLL